MPFFQNYFQSEATSIKNKIKSAFKKFFLILIIQFLILSCFIIYLNKKHNRIEIYGILIALANSFGFFLIILALGYSLVALPRKIKNLRITSGHIFQKRIKLELISKKKDEYLILLENVYKLLYNLAIKCEKKNGLFKIDLNQIKDLMDQNIIKNFQSGLDDYYDEEMITTTYNNLTKKFLKKKIKELKKNNIKFQKLKQKEKSINEYIKYYQKYKSTLRLKLRNLLIMILFIKSVIFSIISFLIEVLIPFQTKYNFNIYNLSSKIIGEKITYVIFVYFMFYLVICVIFSVMKIEIGTFYWLQKKNTSYSSLIFYTL